MAAPDFNFLQGKFARMKEAADMLHKQAATTKAEMRKGKIAASMSSIKTAAGKRMVCSFLRCTGCDFVQVEAAHPDGADHARCCR